MNVGKIKYAPDYNSCFCVGCAPGETKCPCQGGRQRSESELRGVSHPYEVIPCLFDQFKISLEAGKSIGLSCPCPKCTPR